MATPAFDVPARTELPLLIAFADLTRYSFMSTRVGDEALAQTMDAYYERVAARIEAGGGRVVKFIGDAALAVFPPEAADRAVAALLELKEEVDRSFEALGWECRLIVKVHFGPVIAGPYGASGAKRFDVLGKAVNAAAMLDSTGIALSAEAFRKLGPETRKRFKKHTPTITYIRTEDPHRFRRR
jgi:adenylate cyclase